MAIDRRSFFAGGAIGAASLVAAEQAKAAPCSIASVARSVTDFGVELGAERDQTVVLQKALNEIAASGHPAFLPPGIYQTQNLNLPQGVEICGAPGKSIVRIRGSWVFSAADSQSSLCLRNLVLTAQEKALLTSASMGGASAPLIDVRGGQLTVDACRIRHSLGSAFHLQHGSAKFQNVEMETIQGNGIEAIKGVNLSVSHCSIRDCAGSGIIFTAGKSSQEGVIIATRVSQCGGNGVEASGRAIVTANIVEGCAGFGLRLGSAKGSEHVLASQNSISNCRVGIGVAAEGDYIFAALNVIAGAREGAIRALAGDKLVGPDLSQKSTESFRNLTVIGNVTL